jgi:hypothetical protein
MSRAILSKIEEIRKNAARASAKNDIKGLYPVRKRMNHAHDLQKEINRLNDDMKKDLGSTRLTNQLSGVIQNLVSQLNQGDNAIDLLKVINLCDTITRNL